MKLRNKPFLKRTFFVLIALLFLLIAGWFGVRNYVLKKAVEKAEEKCRNEYDSELTIQSVSFNRFKTVTLVDIVVVPHNKDTLFTADTLRLNPSLADLLEGHLGFISVRGANMLLNLVKHDSISNFSNFFRHTDSLHEVHRERNYAALANKMLNNTLDLLPSNITMQHLYIRTDINDKKESSLISLIRRGKDVHGIVNDVTLHKIWHIDGTIHPSSKTFALKVFGIDNTDQISIPFTEDFFNAKLSFDTLLISIDKNRFTHDHLSLSGNISTTGLVLHHEKIANDDVAFDQLSFDFDATVTRNAIKADTTSILRINKVVGTYGVSYANDSSKEYSLDFKTGFMPANDFFASLPQGMFNNFQGIDAAGNLQYTLHFKLNNGMPDSVEFESSLKKEGFHIIKYGVTNFAMLNNDFIYTAYEHDKPFRTINVSPANADFTPLPVISNNVVNAVLTSEDGSFFSNNGFNEGAFKKSIAQNYEAGRFVRGGSTITMQLVKNVFLSRHKTIARKAEEALIVWLIESNHLVSKERMLEVYLNIAELGPNIYGISEAARFYFDKKPSQLTLPESIFIASLLPRPKWFKYSFDTQGNLKPYFADYFRVVSNFLLKRGLITEEEHNKLKPEITLTGPARAFVVPSDSIPVSDENPDE